MSHQTVQAARGQHHTSPIPQGVVANGFAFLSAIRGVDADTQKVPEDREQQARNVFRVLTETLGSFGATLADVVHVGVYMVDLQADRPLFNTIWKEHFGERAPARFAVQVMDMGGPGDASRFLLDVTAAVPGGGS